MGLFTSLIKKEAYPLQKLNEAEFKAADSIIAKYKTFYQKYNEEYLCLYGLTKPEEMTSPFHTQPEADKRFAFAFPFQTACVFEDIKNLKQKEDAISKAAYGNIPIASEGCNIFWILVVSGTHAGEVWMLTDYGITPVGEKMTLDRWYKAMTGPDPGFWYDLLELWGPEKNAFFLNHAAVKMADISENVFAVSAPLCLTCQNLLGKTALHEDTYFVVTDPVYTYLFGTQPPENSGNGWILTDLQNGVKFYKAPKESIPQKDVLDHTIG